MTGREEDDEMDGWIESEGIPQREKTSCLHRRPGEGGSIYDIHSRGGEVKSNAMLEVA